MFILMNVKFYLRKYYREPDTILNIFRKQTSDQVASVFESFRFESYEGF